MTEPKTLSEVWQERCALLKEAKEKATRAHAARSDVFTVPRGAKVMVWYSSIASYYEADKLEYEANCLFWKADEIWANAVYEAKGNIKLDWEEKDGLYKCKLETGEIFEP